MFHGTVILILLRRKDAVIHVNILQLTQVYALCPSGLELHHHCSCSQSLYHSPIGVKKEMWTCCLLLQMWYNYLTVHVQNKVWRPDSAVVSCIKYKLTKLLLDTALINNVLLGVHRARASWSRKVFSNIFNWLQCKRVLRNEMFCLLQMTHKSD